MYEYHGWAKIAQSTTGEEEDNIPKIVKKIQSKIDEIKSENRILTLKAINGWYILSIAGLRNHKTLEITEVFELYNLVATNAKGSYGLLYCWDDEDDEFYNEFVVWRLARGKFERFKDSLLSPCNPTIDD